MAVLKKATILIVLIISACSAPTPQGGDFPPQGLDATEIGEVLSGGDATKEGSFRPTGWWAVLRVNDQCIILPGVKHAYEMYHYSINVAHMVPDESGRVVKVRMTTCKMGDSPMLGLATSYPQALVDSVNPWEVQAVLTGSKEGALYVESPRVETWGIKIDPYKEEFPKDPGDSRIWDQDKDGKPGATLIMGNHFCELYLAQYTVRQFYGEVKSATRIEGSGTSSGKKMIIDATDPFCKPKNRVIPNDQASKLLMIRVDGEEGAVDLDSNNDGEVDCDELLAHFKELFVLPKVDDSRCKWVKEGG